MNCLFRSKRQRLPPAPEQITSESGSPPLLQQSLAPCSSLSLSLAHSLSSLFLTCSPLAGFFVLFSLLAQKNKTTTAKKKTSIFLLLLIFGYVVLLVLLDDSLPSFAIDFVFATVFGQWFLTVDSASEKFPLSAATCCAKLDFVVCRWTEDFNLNNVRPWTRVSLTLPKPPVISLFLFIIISLNIIIIISAIKKCKLLWLETDCACGVSFDGEGDSVRSKFLRLIY